MIAAALSALLLSATPRLEGSITAGGGYDTNLNYAGASAAAAGSGYGAVRAAGGAAFDVADATSLYAGVRADAEGYPSYTSLNTGSVGAELSLVQDLGDRVAVVLTPWVTQSWSGESGRDATTLAGQATLRVKPVRDLALRGFYAYLHRSADEAVFSSEKHRVGASAEWRLAPRTYLSVAGWLERGDEAFWRSTTRMRREAAPADAYASALARTAAVSPALEVGLDGPLHLVASWELRVVRSSAADLATHSLFLGVGARL